MQYCIYLRKSRADMEAEVHGEGETLARHENTLKELAKRQSLPVVRIYKEIVSGENIAARPEMQKLLADVNEGIYDGVLVMEIERLARGDTIDQGVVAQAFRDSSTKIITPVKTYDPNNELDEEYFEFSLFMSRREYKTIRRRMNAGRLAAVKEGNYVCSKSPYGYNKISPSPKIHTLEINPEQAEIVKLIYDMYLNTNKGTSRIAMELNSMGVPGIELPEWKEHSVRTILSSIVYTGVLPWKTKGSEREYYKGLHEPIISKEKFESVQRKFKSSPYSSKVRSDYSLKNHYQGLMFCKNCGIAMERNINSRKKLQMCCRTKDCVTSACKLDIIDELIFSQILNRRNEYKKIEHKTVLTTNKHIDTEKILKSELSKLINQQNKLCDFLEQGIYDSDTYLERSKLIKSKISDINKKLKEIELAKVEIIPPEEMSTRLDDVVENFYKSENAEVKNRLLKAIIKRIEYSKTLVMHKNGDSDLEISIEFL